MSGCLEACIVVSGSVKQHVDIKIGARTPASLLEREDTRRSWRRPQGYANDVMSISLRDRVIHVFYHADVDCPVEIIRSSHSYIALLFDHI